MTIRHKTFTTKEEIIKDIQRIYSMDVEINQKSIIKNLGKRNYLNLLSLFGSLHEALIESGLSIEDSWHKRSKEEITKIILKAYKENGEVTLSLLGKKYKLFDKAIYRCFENKSFEEILTELKIPLKIGQRKNISKEDCIKEIYRIQREFGYVSKPIMEKNSNINTKVVQRIWGNYGNMYEELKLDRHPSGVVNTDEEIIEDVKRIYEKYHTINTEILNKEGKFSTFVYKHRFGGLYKTYEKAGITKLFRGGSAESDYVIQLYAKALNEEPEYEKTFEWLKSPRTNAKLRLDAFFEKEKLAIEYNGPQHYMLVKKYEQTEEDLKVRQEIDAFKIKICKEHGIKTIVVKYKDIVDENYIKNSLL